MSSHEELNEQWLTAVALDDARDEIEAAKTPRGGWTKAQLAEWGVPWPPPRGWKKLLEQKDGE